MTALRSVAIASLSLALLLAPLAAGAQPAGRVYRVGFLGLQMGPEDPPFFEQPTKFELIINLKTARALGLTISPSMLAAGGRGDRMKTRRAFLTGALLLGLFAAPLAADAQQAGKVYRVGTLFQGTRGPAAASFIEALERGLRELGWVEGRNIAFEHRYGNFKRERLPDLAAELVRLKVDVIVASGSPPAVAARQATATLPIVAVGAAESALSSFVASLARPGGNVTGVIDTVAPDVGGKRLQLLKEIAPKISRVAFLRVPVPGEGPHVKAIEDAARALGLGLQLVEVRDPADLPGAFAAIRRERADALYLWWQPLTIEHRKEIVDFAATSRLPAASQSRMFADAGGLLSYGVDYHDLFRRGATYVDKLLKGARAADLPIEQPTKFALVINMRTARGLGLAVPPSVLVGADEVIE